MVAPAAEEQSDNKYKHILFIKTSPSEQTAVILYFMPAFDSRCDPLSLGVSADRRFSVNGRMWTIFYSTLFLLF